MWQKEREREKWNWNDYSALSDHSNMIFTEVLPVYETLSHPACFLHLCCLWIFNAWTCIKSLWSALVCFGFGASWRVYRGSVMHCFSSWRHFLMPHFLIFLTVNRGKYLRLSWCYRFFYRLSWCYWFLLTGQLTSNWWSLVPNLSVILLWNIKKVIFKKCTALWYRKLLQNRCKINKSVFYRPNQCLLN